MTTTLPDIPDAGRYTPKQAAEYLGIHRNTLTNYCNDGKISFGIRKTNGRKFFTGAEIKRVWKATY